MDFLNDATYVDQAERIIKDLSRPIERNGKFIKPTLVSMSKIRNILSMAADIYDEALRENSTKLNPELTARIEYLRVRMIYEVGRESFNRNGQPTKDFFEKTHLIEYTKMIGDDKAKLKLFYTLERTY